MQPDEIVEWFIGEIERQLALTPDEYCLELDEDPFGESITDYVRNMAAGTALSTFAFDAQEHEILVSMWYALQYEDGEIEFDPIKMIPCEDCMCQNCSGAIGKVYWWKGPPKYHWNRISESN